MLLKKEHEIQKFIVSYLRRNNIFVFETDVMDGLKFLTRQYDRLVFINHHKKMGYYKGQSDLVILEKGTCRFVEVKTAKGHQQESQKEFEEIVKAHNMKYEIWRDIDDAVDYVKNLRERVVDEL